MDNNNTSEQGNPEILNSSLNLMEEEGAGNSDNFEQNPYTYTARWNFGIYPCNSIYFPVTTVNPSILEVHRAVFGNLDLNNYQYIENDVVVTNDVEFGTENDNDLENEYAMSMSISAPPTPISPIHEDEAQEEIDDNNNNNNNSGNEEDEDVHVHVNNENNNHGEFFIAVCPRCWVHFEDFTEFEIHDCVPYYYYSQHDYE